ncbi:MAG TPA: GNAT family N-acetyltransferase [Solirubrobacteraceae bacterium]|nr:GNAT family N-acetyltransferase [Solirubrobacteraceae bacterium]
MAVEDWPAVQRIYRAGIDAGNATFETEIPSWERWRAARLAEPCLIARDGGSGGSGSGGDGDGDSGGDDGRGGGEAIGWAALTPSSARAAYAGVAEVSIYVDPSHAGRGVGRVLLGALIDASERAGIWTLRAGIFPENVASIALHKRCGFRLVGTQERMGRMPDGRWRDVILYERRSEVVGTQP